MKILLKGYYGFGNLGDDILMIVSYKLLSKAYPDAAISVFSNNSINNKDSKAPKGFNSYIISLLNTDVEIIDWTYKGHFDLIFHGGGGTLFDVSKGSINTTFLNRIGQNLQPKKINIVELALRKIFSIPPNITYNQRIGIGLGVGPFTPNGKNVLRILSVIGSFDKLMVRDLISARTLNELGHKGVVDVGSDLAYLTSFWFDKDYYKLKLQSSNRIAIILKGQSPELHAYYKNLALELINNGYEVEFFAFDKLFDEDYISCIGNDYTINIWDPHKSSLMNYVNKLWACSVCITDRAHGAILASIGEVIPLIIRSSEKSDQIFQMLELKNLMSDNECKTMYTIKDISSTFVHKSTILHRLSKTVSSNYGQLSTSLDYLI